MTTINWKAALRRTTLSVTVVTIAAGAMLSTTASAKAVNLTGAGATFPYPLYAKWFDVYGRQSGTQINYQAIGSGGGIQQIKNNTVDFGASDAPLSNADLSGMPAPIVQIPTVAGGVAVIYNGLPRGLRLSGQALANIYLGQITRWNDPQIAGLNPGMRLPGRAITVVRRSDGSGTSYIFTNYLKSVSPSWARQVGAGKTVAWPVGVGGKGSDGVASNVQQISGSIGYVELNYAIQNRVPYAAMRNRSGQFVSPTVASVTAAASASAGAIQRDVRALIVNAPGAGSYPISGFTYLLIYKNQTNKAKGQTLKKFLNWAMGPGQSYARPLYYAPLPQSVKRINAMKLRSVR